MHGVMTTQTVSPYLNSRAAQWRTTPGRASAHELHRSMTGYAPTTLGELPALAAELGVGRVFVKDESDRLSLPAFKILGASWAVCRAVAQRIGLPAENITAESLREGLRAAGPPPAHGRYRHGRQPRPRRRPHGRPAGPVRPRLHPERRG